MPGKACIEAWRPVGKLAASQVRGTLHSLCTALKVTATEAGSCEMLPVLGSVLHTHDLILSSC